MLQEKSVEEHRKRYHWAFDVDEARGDPRLHLLADGSWISKEQRRVVDEVCAPKGAEVWLLMLTWRERCIVKADAAHPQD